MTDNASDDAVIQVVDMKARFILRENIDPENRVISLYKPISEKSFIDFSKAMTFLEGIGKSPITVIVSTQGGSVYDGLAIIDRIQNSKCEVHTVATGFVASMGIPILASGDVRKTTKNTTFMFHEISSGQPLSRLTTVEVDTKHTIQLNRKMCRIMSENSLKNYAWWVKTGKHVDYYFDSDKAIELGVVDGIVGDEYE